MQAENQTAFPPCRSQAPFRPKAEISRCFATDCTFSAEIPAAYRCAAQHTSPCIPPLFCALLSPHRAPFLSNFRAFSYTIFSFPRAYSFPFYKTFSPFPRPTAYGKGENFFTRRIRRLKNAYSSSSSGRSTLWYTSCTSSNSSKASSMFVKTRTLSSGSVILFCGIIATSACTKRIFGSSSSP